MTRARMRVALFLFVWASCCWFGSWEFNPNNATRLFASVGLVERGSAAIDRMAATTIDKSRFGAHFYLDKAPGMTLMALPAVALADALTQDREAAHPADVNDHGLARYYRLRLRLAVATGPALLTALAAVLLYEIGIAITGSAAAGLFAAIGYALGAPIWGWSTTVFGHSSVAALYVVALWAGWQGPRLRHGFCAGLALGWAVGIEYQAVLAGAAIGIWIVWRAWHRPAHWRLYAAMLLGGLIAAVPIAAYNGVAFGTVFRIGYSGVVGYEGMRHGLFGLGLPRPVLLWEITFGVHKGLFWIAPALLMALRGLAMLERCTATQGLARTAAAVVAIVLLVNAAYYYWDGGNATGPRHAMPLIGALAIGFAPFWAALRSRGARIAALAVMGLSIVLNAVIAAAEILSPPQFTFPIWSAVIRDRFLQGDMRTWPSEWLGWSPWTGFALYVALAVPALLLLARAACRADRLSA
ncbi:MULTISPECIES: hypothetical protein [unclassified Sphingomonas]|uniref:hypothetical protein n=1 Tax=unclassified Sphingomonas TaxID=196159 RepID=UPI00226A457D|nr:MULTISPECIES: hypothetical protein [unclassified Sphingomonas]